jgi:hypothetical protein
MNATTAQTVLLEGCVCVCMTIIFSIYGVPCTRAADEIQSPVPPAQSEPSSDDVQERGLRRSGLGITPKAPIQQTAPSTSARQQLPGRLGDGRLSLTTQECKDLGGSIDVTNQKCTDAGYWTCSTGRGSACIDGK